MRRPLTLCLSSVTISQVAILLTGLFLCAASTPAQRQFDELSRLTVPPNRDATQAIVRGDVDRDGDVDLVIGNFGQSRLYLNNGNGTFADATAARMPTSGVRTNALALGDVDSDGDLDLIPALSGHRVTCT